MRQFYPEEGINSNNPKDFFYANSLFPRSIRAHADLIDVFKVKRGHFAFVKSWPELQLVIQPNDVIPV